jgi:hypothetical protein
MQAVQTKPASQQVVSQVVALLRQSGSAHHQAFIEVNGEDAEWPLWYAEYLLQPLKSLLQAEFTKSELVYLLVKAEKERFPGTDWPLFYTEVFLNYFGIK